MREKKFLLFFLLISINVLSFSSYSYSIEADIFVQSTVNRASEALDNKYSKDEKIKKLKAIANDTVDIKGIGLYTLGAYRKKINNDQLKIYTTLFEQYFLKSFSSRLAEYSNPQIEVKSKEKINDNYTIVSSILVSTEQRPEVMIDWRIYTKNPENPLIRDLIIEGFSLARTQREEFSSILESNNEDFNALFSTLKEFIK